MVNLTSIARTLRKTQTDAEKKLWRTLRSKQLEGFKFRRQQPVGKYILDFVCLDKLLVVELDGGQHGKDEGKKMDAIRDEWLTQNGYKVLRFWNHEVLNNTHGILETIRKELLER